MIEKREEDVRELFEEETHLATVICLVTVRSLAPSLSWSLVEGLEVKYPVQ